MSRKLMVGQRRVAFVSVAVVLATLGLAGRSAPASAVRLCGPGGTIHTTSGVPFIPDLNNASYGFLFRLGDPITGIGTCAPELTALESAYGTMWGLIPGLSPSCVGGWEGHGTTSSDQPFDYFVAGGVLIAEGPTSGSTFAGAAFILPDASKGDYCLPADALGRVDDFVVIGTTFTTAS